MTINIGSVVSLFPFSSPTLTQMSSFDQSRGFGPPSSLTRQDTWSASDGWGGSHASSGIGSPPPPINHSVPLATSSSLSSTNGFQQFASVAANDLGQSRRTEQTRELDYSVIDSDQGLVRTGGFTDDAGEGQDLLSATAKDWKLPEQDKVSVHLSPQLEGTILQRHHVWVVVSGHGVRNPLPSLLVKSLRFADFSNRG